MTDWNAIVKKRIEETSPPEQPPQDGASVSSTMPKDPEGDMGLPGFPQIPSSDKKFQLLPGEKFDQSAANRGTLVKAASNMPSSLFDVAKNIYEAVSHPVETAKAVGNVALGVGQKLILGEQPEEKNVDALVEFYSKRYGGTDKIRETIEKDPAGFLVDLSTVLGGAGGATKLAATASKTAGLANTGERLATAGAAMAKTAATVDPISIASTGIVNTAGKLIPSKGVLSPERLYQGSLKMGTGEALSQEERIKRVATGLENGIMPTVEGLDKVRNLIGKIDNEVQATISKGGYGGNPISTDAVISYLGELKEFAKNTLTQESLLKIEKIEERFKKAHGTAMSVEDAHQLKKNTYVELNKFYDQFQRNAAIETKKQLARGLKEEVYNLYPELRELGKEEGALIALQDSLEKAVKRINNRDVVGIGIPIKGVMGASVGGPQGGAIGLVSGLLDTPIVKARLAHALYKAREGVGPLKGSELRSALFQSRRLEDLIDEEER